MVAVLVLMAEYMVKLLSKCFIRFTNGWQVLDGRNVFFHIFPQFDHSLTVCNWCEMYRWPFYCKFNRQYKLGLLHADTPKWLSTLVLSVSCPGSSAFSPVCAKFFEYSCRTSYVPAALDTTNQKLPEELLWGKKVKNKSCSSMGSYRNDVELYLWKENGHISPISFFI